MTYVTSIFSIPYYQKKQRTHRDFVYCYSVTGRHFCRVDHFSPQITPTAFWDETPVNIAHFPQHRFVTCTM